MRWTKCNGLLWTWRLKVLLALFFISFSFQSKLHPKIPSYDCPCFSQKITQLLKIQRANVDAGDMSKVKSIKLSSYYTYKWTCIKLKSAVATVFPESFPGDVYSGVKKKKKGKCRQMDSEEIKSLFKCKFF